MSDFSKVFFMNLVSDIDNMLILGTILRKHSYLNIAFLAAVVLTFTRTMYVVLVEVLSNLPMFHFLMGIILLFIAFKLVTRSVTVDLHRPAKSSIYLKTKVLFLLAATDFLICWDGVIIISRISQHVVLITLGIFCSLLISLYFLRLIVKLAATFFWINIISGGFIAQNAIIGIAQDPWLADWVYYIDELVPEVNIVDLAANAAVIIIVVIGLFSYIKHHRVTIHR